MGRGVARRDHVHVTPKFKLRVHTMFKSVTPRVCLAKVPFLASFGPDMKTEMGVVIYMYLNIPQILLIPNIYGFMGLIP